MKKYYIFNVEVREPWNEYEQAWIGMEEADFAALKAYLDGENDDFDVDGLMDAVNCEYMRRLVDQHFSFFDKTRETPLVNALNEAREEYDEEIIDKIIVELTQNSTFINDTNEALCELSADIGVIEDLSLDEEDGYEFDEIDTCGCIVVEL